MRMRKFKIVFVCTGNTCRSPMAEIILKQKLKLASVTGVFVTSAGLSAEKDAKISKNSAKALKELGYKVYGFKSKQLTTKMLETSDLVLCMTKAHKDWLHGYKNVFTVAEYTGLSDVADPYGKELNMYIKTSHQIVDICDAILDKILKFKGEN